MENQRDRVIFCALLAPLLRAVPAQMAGQGRELSWLLPLAALPILCLGERLLSRTLSRLPPSSGLPSVYELAWGRGVGQCLTALTIVWMGVTASRLLIQYCEAFVFSIYRNTSLWFFALPLMVLAWQLAEGGEAVLCRSGRLFLPFLLLILAAILSLSIPDIHGREWLPEGVWHWELARGVVPVLSLLALSIPLRYAPGRKGEGGGIKWMTWLCVISVVSQLILLGLYGWQTVSRLKTPLYSAAKELELAELPLRLESVAAAVWVFSDLCLMSLLLHAMLCYGRSLWRGWDRKWMTGALGAVILLGAMWWEKGKMDLSLWDLGLWYGLPAVSCLLCFGRERFGNKR